MIHETTSYTIHNFRIQTKYIENYTMSTHHFHDVYELYYLNQGSRNYFIGDATYHVNEGDLVLIKPHDIHKTIDVGVSHSRLLISFRPDFLPFLDIDQLLDQCFKDSRVLSLDLNLQQVLEERLRLMVLTSVNQDPYYQGQLQAQLFDLLLFLAEQLDKQAHTSQAPRNHDKVYDIIHYLKLNYHQDLHLDDIAETFFISRFYMARLFKKATGFTIVEYLHSLRIVEAQKLLKETKLKVIDVAQKVGFTNVSSFGKIFKSVTGSSPSDYRKQHK